MILKQAEQYPYRVAAGAFNPHLPWDPPDTSLPTHTYLHPKEVMGYARSDNDDRNIHNLPQLADDLDARGMQEPISIETNGTHAVIGDGHHRARAALARGWNKVPVNVTDDPYLDTVYYEENTIGPGLSAFLKQRKQR